MEFRDKKCVEVKCQQAEFNIRYDSCGIATVTVYLWPSG